MKMALVQDQILVKSGAERVFLYMLEAFPEADAYTLAYNPAATFPEFARHRHRIRQTWLGAFVRNHDTFKLAFPLATHVMQGLDLRDYDIILSSSMTVAKYVRRHQGKHICYCYFFTRAIWRPETYTDSRLRYVALRAFLKHLRNREMAAVKKIDAFLTISSVSQRAIEQVYGRQATVLPPPVDNRFFTRPMVKPARTNYLLVSRLVKWKQVDYAIEAFNTLGLELRVVGTGDYGQALRSMARSNIKFLGEVSDEDLLAEYLRAKAVIFPGDQEYNLIALEANAAGSPVIALGRGATPGLVISADTSTPPGRATGLLYQQPTATDLAQTVRRFDASQFDEAVLVAHAATFGVGEFKRKLCEYVQAIA